MTVENQSQGRVGLKRGTGEASNRGFVPLSVVIPSVEHAGQLLESLTACARAAGSLPLELIAIHDGTLDADSRQLRATLASEASLPCRLIRARTLQDARSLGVRESRYEHVLILSQDVTPVSEDFFRIHASLHSSCPDKSFAVLGAVSYPGQPVNATALTLGGLLGNRVELRSAAQDCEPSLDCRYFRDSNISIKRALVSDWNTDGFCPDFPGTLGIAELARRLGRQGSGGLKFLYEPAALASCRRSMGLKELMEAQISTGRLLKLLGEGDPESPRDLGLQPYIEAASSDAGGPRMAEADYSAILDGIKAWARIVETQGGARDEAWYPEYLAAVLEVCLLEGFAAACGGGAIQPRSAGLILERFTRRVRQLLHRELSSSAQPSEERAAGG